MTSYVAFILILMVASIHLCASDSWGKHGNFKKIFEDVYDFVLELREGTDNMLTYLTKIQQIFCPEQPVCDDKLTHGTNNNNNDTFLFEELYIANESVQIKDLKYLVGVCCLPCSCSDICSEDDNCCLSKDVASVTNGAVKSECIAATAESYQRNIYTPGLMYFMINHCFRNDTNASTISNCESPDRYVIGDTIPVTSLTTGRTYWNKHCAICNADVGDVVSWNSSAIFDGFILHSPSSITSDVMPQTLEEIYTYLQKRKRSTLIYTTPLPMQHKRCIRDNDVRSCTHQWNELADVDEGRSFLFEACNQYSSQVVVGSPIEVPYKNIFCFFCRKQGATSRTSCDSESAGKFHSSGKISALLNYRQSSNDGRDGDAKSISGLAGALRGNCACSQVYDKYNWLFLLMQWVGPEFMIVVFPDHTHSLPGLVTKMPPCPNKGECRPLFCPPGEFIASCRCVALMSNITGMQVFLRLKVEPQEGQTLPSSDVKRRKMRIALRKLLQTTSKGNNVEVLATFRNTNSDRPYYFVIATVTSAPGNDIKEALEPFLDYIDGSNSMEMSVDKTKLMVRLTKEVQFRGEKNGTFFFTAKELLNGKSELTPQYLKESLRKPTRSLNMLIYGNYQLLSPLLFCKQVQLEGNEFQEDDGIIRVNTTASMLSVYDYIRVDDSHVRVCLEEYLQAPVVSSGAGLNLQTSSLLAIGIIYEYFFVYVLVRLYGICYE